MTSSITLPQPFDAHIHLRDESALSLTATQAAEQFAYAVVMPNLKPPITTVTAAEAYAARIMRHVPKDSNFTPLMTLYFTEQTSAHDIRQAAAAESIVAVKYYPAGATTHSDAGVRDIRHVYPILETMQEVGLPLLIHGEVTDPHVDIFDRERYFIEQILQPLLVRFPALKVVLEHITTAEAAAFVSEASSLVAATITAHHLLINRNALFQGGIRPHHYCLPVLKRETHRQALVKAAISGNPKFFLGTDSAPHAKSTKETACGCAGIYTAHAAIELYAEAFDSVGALDKLPKFASCFGPAFYGLAPAKQTITLAKQAWQVPDHYALGEHTLVPFRAGEMLAWQRIST